VKITQNPSANTSVEIQRNNEANAKASSHVEKNYRPQGNDATQVTISEDAKLFNQAVLNVKNTPDKKSEKVADLKKKIQEGNYAVHAESLADKIIQDHLFNDFGKNRI